MNIAATYSIFIEMASHQQGYPQGSMPGYEVQSQEQYDPNQQGAMSPAPGSTPAPPAAGKKKRAYAGQAYEFGGGANAALGGQQVGGGQYPPPPQAQGYEGYNQQAQPPAQQTTFSNQQYGSGPASPAMGGPTYGQQAQNVGGYQSPAPGYPATGAPQQSMGGITQGMSNVSVGQQHPQMQGRPPMNQLYPSDIMSAPLNVTELDLPPPPINLPPNVCVLRKTCRNLADISSPA